MDDYIIGEIRLAGFDGIPDGWAACDGQALSVSEHQALFAAIGTTYGGNGRTNFRLPDLRGGVAVHAGANGFKLGASGGAERHALATAELPAHQHELLLAPPAGNERAGDGQSYLTDQPIEHVAWTAVDIGAKAVGSAHDNMQPYLGLTFMIAVGPSGRTQR